MFEKTDYDVVIVGGGPAGLWSARKFAEEGLSAIVIDKKQEIGVPVRCGEGLGNTWFNRLNLTPDPDWAVQEMYGAALWSPSGKKLEIRFPEVSGYLLERRIFEKDLARRAARAGAEIVTKTYVTDAIKEGTFARGVKARMQGEKVEFTGKLVVAADGFESTIGRMFGLQNQQTLYHSDSGYEYEMAGLKMDDPDLIHLYFGNEVAPRGYVWIFPKGKDYANVGIGIGADNPKTAKYYLDKWVNSSPVCKGASIVQVNGGGIPVGGMLKNMVGDGIMLVGDAAHQVSPIHGGGMGLAMEASNVMVEVAAKAIKAGNVSEAALSEYNTTWWNLRGYELEKLVRIRQLFEKLTDKDMETFAAAFTGPELLKFAYSDKITSAALATTKLIKHPSLLKLALKYLDADPKE
ncbi:MAG: NAD(P)/FAD-dependent oxidoreductase [Candidatus Diapherotrites archaeon]|nr:NAD(P)/FAD-dependent oxidoreductase [Candidatus Diapherotrites archaeon]